VQSSSSAANGPSRGAACCLRTMALAGGGIRGVSGKTANSSPPQFLALPRGWPPQACRRCQICLPKAPRATRQKGRKPTSAPSFSNKQNQRGLMEEVSSARGYARPVCTAVSGSAPPREGLRWVRSHAADRIPADSHSLPGTPADRAYGPA